MAWHVYRGVNHDLAEVYHGVSQDPRRRIDGSHCVGGTAAIAHWDCSNHDISWRRVSTHRSQPAASQVAHSHERNFRHRGGYTNLRTSGI
jgi:hypothetical protein